MASCPHVFVTTADTFHSFLMIAKFPLEESCEGIVERVCGILTVLPRKFLELRPAFRFERDRVQLGLACSSMIQRDSLSAKHYLIRMCASNVSIPLDIR